MASYMYSWEMFSPRPTSVTDDDDRQTNRQTDRQQPSQ